MSSAQHSDENSASQLSRRTSGITVARKRQASDTRLVSATLTESESPVKQYTLDTLRALTNLTATYDLSDIDRRVASDIDDMSADDARYLREHGTTHEDMHLVDVTDFCSFWHVPAIVCHDGARVALVTTRGSVALV